VYALINRSFLEGPVSFPPAGIDTGQDFDPFIEGLHLPDVELAFSNGLYNLLFEHEILFMAYRDDHPWSPVNPFVLQVSKKAFNLLISPSALRPAD